MNKEELPRMNTTNQSFSSSDDEFDEMLQSIFTPKVKTEAEVFVTRISPTNTESIKDFERFEEEILLHGNGLWDKDSKNKMKLGDYWIVLVGKSPDIQLKYFRITADLSHLPRPSHWKCLQPYNTSNGTNSVCHRGLIRLEPVFMIESLSWDQFKKLVVWNFTGNNMPRGTTRIKKKNAILDML